MSDEIACSNNYEEILRDMFPKKLEEQIRWAVSYVNKYDKSDDFDGKLGSMINILTESEDVRSDYMCINTGQNIAKNKLLLRYYYNKVLDFFPNICPQYLWEFCNKRKNYFDLSMVVSQLVEEGYSMKNDIIMDIFDSLNMESLVSLLIDQLGYNKCLKFLSHPPKAVLNLSEASALCSLQDGEFDVQFTLNFLYNHFSYLRIKDINSIFKNYNKNLVQVYSRLKKQPMAFRKPRKPIEFEIIQDIHVEVLKEIFYLKNENMFNKIEEPVPA